MYTEKKKHKMLEMQMQRQENERSGAEIWMIQ